MTHFRLAVFFLALFLLHLDAKPAYAIEPLNFSRDIGFTAKQRLSFYLDDAQAASIDLNGDSKPEYILKNTTCETAEPCDYQVFAFSKERVLRLAHFKARKVVVSDKKTHGVRNLIVYNHPVDDFRSTPFVWDVRKIQFVESF